MKQLLYIDCAIRRQKSRTLELVAAFLQQRRALGSVAVNRIVLADENLQPLNEARLAERNLAVEHGDFRAPAFRWSQMLQHADELLIAAPCYDLSFPALLKLWLEAVMVPNLTFRYSEDGRTVGMLPVKHAWYVTTIGGYRTTPDFGFDYLKALLQTYWSIPDVRLLAAEGLDVKDNDPEAILAAAQARIPAEMFSGLSL